MVEYSKNLPIPEGYELVQADFLGDTPTKQKLGYKSNPDRIRADILRKIGEGDQIQRDEKTGQAWQGYIRCNDIRCENWEPQRNSLAYTSQFGELKRIDQRYRGPGIQKPKIQPSPIDQCIGEACGIIKPKTKYQIRQEILSRRIQARRDQRYGRKRASLKEAHNRVFHTYDLF